MKNSSSKSSSYQNIVSKVGRYVRILLRGCTWSDETSFPASRQVFEEARFEMREPGKELVKEHHVVAALLRSNLLLAQKSGHQST